MALDTIVLAERLRLLRSRELGQSVEEAAALVHAVPATWSAWEAGDERVPLSALHLYCLLNAVDHRALLGLEQTEEERAFVDEATAKSKRRQKALLGKRERDTPRANVISLHGARQARFSDQKLAEIISEDARMSPGGWIESLVGGAQEFSILLGRFQTYRPILCQATSPGALDLLSDSLEASRSDRVAIAFLLEVGGLSTPAQRSPFCSLQEVRDVLSAGELALISDWLLRKV